MSKTFDQQSRFTCPECKSVMAMRRTKWLSDKTRTKTYTCSGVDCGLTFDTFEEVHQIRVPSGHKSRQLPINI